MNAEELDSEEFSNKFSDYFEFKAILGKGAFGVVISAIKKTDNREYAVKVKNNCLSCDDLFRSFKNKTFHLLTGTDYDKKPSFYQNLTTATSSGLKMYSYNSIMRSKLHRS